MAEPRNPNEGQDPESWRDRDEDIGRGWSDEQIGGRTEEGDEFEEADDSDEEEEDHEESER